MATTWRAPMSVFKGLCLCLLWAPASTASEWSGRTTAVRLLHRINHEGFHLLMEAQPNDPLQFMIDYLEDLRPLNRSWSAQSKTGKQAHTEDAGAVAHPSKSNCTLSPVNNSMARQYAKSYEGVCEAQPDEISCTTATLRCHWQGAPTCTSDLTSQVGCKVDAAVCVSKLSCKEADASHFVGKDGIVGACTSQVGCEVDGPVCLAEGNATKLECTKAGAGFCISAGGAVHHGPKWSTGPQLGTSRGYLAAAVLNGKIYALGGYNGDNLKSTEVLQCG